MKTRKLTIFRRFAAVIVSLITILGLLFITITYLATTNYHQASTQLLNKDIAKHLAAFTTAFTPSGINKKIADSVFKNAMVLNPSAEVYFLDNNGKVIYYHALDQEIKQWTIDLKPLKKYIAADGTQYTKAINPKHPEQQQIFSAAAIGSKQNPQGFIYVVLGSNKSENITELLWGSHILKLAIQTFIVIILLSFLVSFLYIQRMRKNFQQMISVLERFEGGDYSARFDRNVQNELEPVTAAFNKMADLLAKTISKLTKAEQDRKNFIATISHDLRTPMSIARGYTETLLLNREKGDISAEDQEYYSRLIYSKMLQIENMVRQLFELSRMEAVEFEPHIEPFVLSEIVQEAINGSQLVAAENNVDLQCTQCLYHVWVNADISMMERVVQNLVDNALKNTLPGGQIQAAISVERDWVIFSIDNTAPPLPQDLLQWINLNTEGDALLERRPQKSGLGLVIVQKILHLHHTLLKASRQGHRNQFTFRLPVYRLPS